MEEGEGGWGNERFLELSAERYLFSICIVLLRDFKLEGRKEESVDDSSGIMGQLYTHFTRPDDNDIFRRPVLSTFGNVLCGSPVNTYSFPYNSR
jgi:hypothetical protein